MNFNPYHVLNVPSSADFETLRAAYRRLARENHPDIAPDKLAATERMAQINRAWAVVGDAAKRAAFDAQWQFHSDERARQEAAHQEAARQEAARREVARREAAARELLRRQALRARAARDNKPAANTARGAKPASTSPKSSTNNGQSAGRGGPKLRSTVAGRSGNREGNRGASSSKSARESAARSTSRTSTSRATAASSASPSNSPSQSGRTFAEETSPRALRLMRKVTLAARVWQRDGNARAAIETCRAVLLADGRNVAARELLAEIYASQHRYELATLMLDQAIQIAPDDRFLRNKRERLEITRAPNQTPRPPARPTFWQRLRAAFGAKNG